jgi:hypothetical protein
MPGRLSSSGLEAVFAQETSAEFVTLLTFTHASLGIPVRVCSGGENTVSRGETYQFFPFDVVRASNVPDAPPQARLVIDNVDRRFVETIRSLAGDLEVAIELVLRSQPSTVEEGPIHLVLRDVSYDELRIEGELHPEPVLSEPCPPDRYTPSRNPALFRGAGGQL